MISNNIRKFLISLLAACCCLAACEKVSPENTPGGSTPAGEIPSAVKIQSVLFRVKDTGEWVKSLELKLLERQTATLEDALSELESFHDWIDI